MKSPISVIMPVYNGFPFLEKAIKSVLNQTYKNFEFIIYDDASRDASWELIKKYQAKDARIKAFRNPKNLGVGQTLNLSLRQAQGVYVARMDADDIMQTHRLEKQVDFLNHNPQVVVAGSWLKEINKMGEIIGKRQLPTKHKDIYRMMFYAMGVQHPTLMFNTGLIPKDFNWYQESGYIEDLDMLFRLFRYGKFINLPEYLMFYRVHKENLSLKYPKKTFKEALRIRKKAVIFYGYKASFRAKILLTLSCITVFLLPEKWINRFYSYFRKLSTFIKYA